MKEALATSLRARAKAKYAARIFSIRQRARRDEKEAYALMMDELERADEWSGRMDDHVEVVVRDIKKGKKRGRE